jgi:hypothetical protein
MRPDRVTFCAVYSNREESRQVVQSNKLLEKTKSHALSY